MDNSKKKSKKVDKTGPSFTNDQLGENEIDKEIAGSFKETGNKKKKK